MQISTCRSPYQLTSENMRGCHVHFRQALTTDEANHEDDNERNPAGSQAVEPHGSGQEQFTNGTRWGGGFIQIEKSLSTRESFYLFEQQYV